MESPLEYTATDDLIIELIRRMDHGRNALLILHVREPEGDNTSLGPLKASFVGGKYAAVGLARQFIHDAMHRQLSSDYNRDNDES